MFTLRCLYCKLSQDSIPPHILSMVDNATSKSAKADIIKHLFDKDQSGNWMMNDKKPMFQQALTLRGMLYGSGSSQSYRS